MAKAKNNIGSEKLAEADSFSTRVSRMHITSTMYDIAQSPLLSWYLHAHPRKPFVARTFYQGRTCTNSFLHGHCRGICSNKRGFQGARMICVILHICWVIYTKTLTHIVSQEDEYTATKNLSFLSSLRKDS